MEGDSTTPMTQSFAGGTYPTQFGYMLLTLGVMVMRGDEGFAGVEDFVVSALQ